MAEPIQLYLDEDAQRNSLVRALRARQIDVLTANEAALVGASDLEQLTFAAAQIVPSLPSIGVILRNCTRPFWKTAVIMRVSLFQINWKLVWLFAAFCGCWTLAPLTKCKIG